MAKSTNSNRAPAAPAAPAVTPSQPAARSTPAPSPQRPSTTVSEVKPSADQIRRRAYEIYQERLARGIRGDATTDWLQAERDIGRVR